MNSLHNRVLLLLLDPDVSDQDFRRFSEYLGRSLPEFLERVSQLRREVRDLSDAIEDRPTRRKVEPSDRTSVALSKVTRLLVSEARLPQRSALSELASRFKHPVAQGESFRNGVQELLVKFGESEVITAAQQIRNEIVHGDKPRDWPLREGNDASPQ